MKKLLLLMCMAGMIAVPFCAFPATELITSTSRLAVDRKNILDIKPEEGAFIRIRTPVEKLWKIVLVNKKNKRELEFTPGDGYSMQHGEGSIAFNVKDKATDGVTMDAQFSITVKDDAFCFSGSVSCSSGDWMVKELSYPCLSGVETDAADMAVYWPEELGMYLTGRLERSFTYPCIKGTMPWFLVSSGEAKLYFGSHDPRQGAKTFSISQDDKTGSLSAGILTPVYSSEYKIPDVMVKLYSGEWYPAANFYRQWYDSHFKPATPPEWIRNSSGWLLAILKQQNLEVMWPYKEIDRLCDVSDQLAIPAITLFGWGVGGHDRYYPNYQPDNLMGGVSEIKNAIKRAHERGKKIILYANGTIFDTSTDYYRYNGNETIFLKSNGEPSIMYFTKQKNTTPVIFALACAGSHVWRKTMFDQGLQAVSLGADGIIYDMVGVVTPAPCFNRNHDHAPGGNDLNYRLQMISGIKTAMKKINPDFMVMTEGTNDLIIRETEYHHGWGSTCTISQNGFPELFRYTFPEVLITQRNPCPMITRAEANFAAVNGLRHEIESRYPADVEYLIHGTLPTADNYSNVTGPPDVKKMNLVPAKQATGYVHSLITFEELNAEFFRTGKFIALDGIRVSGGDIVANGFLNGNRIGVVVWNKHLTEKRDFSVSVPGYRLIKASEPGKSEVSSSSSLDANSIRLLVFENIK